MHAASFSTAVIATAKGDMEIYPLEMRAWVEVVMECVNNFIQLI